MMEGSYLAKSYIREREVTPARKLVTRQKQKGVVDRNWGAPGRNPPKKDESQGKNDEVIGIVPKKDSTKKYA